MKTTILISLMLFCSCSDNFEDVEFKRISHEKVQITNCWKEYAVMSHGELVMQGIGKGHDVLNISDSVQDLTLCVGKCEVVVIKINQ